MNNPFWLALMMALMAAPALASQKTVTLMVPGMTCATCPITVKKALAKVPGVSRTVDSFDKRQAVVTFDDVKATVEQLTRATTDAGYPSSVKASAQ